MMKYNHNHDDAIQKIASLCYRLKTHLGYDAFFDFSPHCDLISVRVHKSGWVAYVDPDWREECWLHFDETDGVLEHIIKKLEGYLEQGENT